MEKELAKALQDLEEMQILVRELQDQVEHWQARCRQAEWQVHLVDLELGAWVRELCAQVCDDGSKDGEAYASLVREVEIDPDKRRDEDEQT